MKLQQYLARLNIAELARDWKIPKSTVYSWYYGTRRPTPENARYIESRTGGKVRFEECY